MKLYLKQKLFSWGDRFLAKDENGNDRFSIEGEIFTWGKKLHVYDRNGKKAAFIRQKVFSWRPRYVIEIGGRVVCEIVKEFTLLKPSYRLEGTSWRLSGNFWAHDYSLDDGRRNLMRLSKKWFSWGDSYELNIADPNNELLCLCVALAVDCVLDSESNANSSYNN